MQNSTLNKVLLTKHTHVFLLKITLASGRSYIKDVGIKLIQNDANILHNLSISDNIQPHKISLSHWHTNKTKYALYQSTW
jgi:hypothetical protein